MAIEGTFLGLLSLALLGALALAAWAWRGRRVDDHPLCRRCGYDLLGGTGQCPECGADTTGARAVRVGNRKRRPRWLAVGCLSAVLSATGIGVIGYPHIVAFDFYTLTPFGWTLRSAVNNAGAPQEPNVIELHRRLTDDALRPGQVDRLVEAALQVQGNRTIAWPEPWEAVLDELLGQSALSHAQVERYFQQGMTLEFETRPVLRRGRHANLNLTNRFDRLTRRTRFSMQRVAEPVMLSDVEIVGAGSFLGASGRSGHHPGAGFSGSYFKAISLPGLPSVPDGATTIDTTFVFEIELREPTAFAPITLRMPAAISIELVAHDAIVDTFETDESQRRAMAGAWTDTRVDTHDGATSVWLRFDHPPVALAMGVWLRQGDDEWRVAALRVQPGSANRWRQVRSPRARRPDDGEVTVELRPEQAAADSQMTLGTYWGDVMRRERIVVNAPYVPAFNLDASLAAEMEQTVSLNHVTIHQTGRGRAISASIGAYDAPAPVAYRVRVRTGDAWVDAAHHQRLTVQAGINSSHSIGGLPLPDPDATTADILLVPNLQWESHPSASAPPWGFPILFEDVPLPDSTRGEAPSGVIRGRALIDEPAGAAAP